MLVSAEFLNDVLNKNIPVSVDPIHVNLIMHNPESLSSDMVDLSHVLTRFSMLNDHSAVQVVAGRIRNMIVASRTAGKISVFVCPPPLYCFCPVCWSVRLSDGLFAPS